MAYSLKALDRQLKNTNTQLKNIQNTLKVLRASLDKNTPGSARYNDIKRQIDEAVARETQKKKEIDQITKAIDTAKKSASTVENVTEKKRLEKNLQVAKDKQDQNAISIAQKAIDDFNARVKSDTRPTGVPADAKFNSVTGNWELGTQKWDKNGQAVVTTPQKKTPTKTATTDTTDTSTADVVGEPAIKPGDVIKTTPEMAAFRAGERGVTGITSTPAITGANIDEIFKAAAGVYGGIDEIFKTDAELRNLLTKAVGKIGDPKDDYSVDRFVSELENTKWFKTNAGPIRQRGFYKRQYDKLVDDLKTNDPDYKAKIDELNKTSEYGRGLVGAEEAVREYVTQYLGINALDDTTIKSIANDIYLYANEGDAVKIRNAVLAAAKYGKGGKVGDVTIGGASGQNLTTLRAIAAANGFDLDKTFATSIPTWLDNLNKGESIETYKKVIRDAAKTSYNVSDRVASLLDQGVDLDTIYSPYKNVMASVLEINPTEVTLKDLSEKGVITNKDQMNLYDFQRALRKDSRWQYTGQAREESSNIALQVLRDFGFQG